VAGGWAELAEGAGAVVDWVTAGRITRGEVSEPGSAEGSMATSIFQSTPIISIAAWRRISSLPPPTKESRAPAVLNPTVRLVASTPST
jgi:hypothetical protein